MTLISFIEQLIFRIRVICGLNYFMHLECTYFMYQQDACHWCKHESRIRTSTALIACEINMRELKQNS